MKNYIVLTALQSVVALSFILFGAAVTAQESAAVKPRAPSAELLSMNGGNPMLTSDGEGITSFKTSYFFHRGVTHVKPYDLSLKIELPTGYTIYNNLAFVVESEAQFTGPNDVVFRIPSATTVESFNNLRILYAAHDPAEPEKPRWVDATLTPSMAGYFQSDLSEAEFKERLPDFGTHQLHAFMEVAPRIFVVALKDSKVSRDHFIADLRIKASPTPETVTEGRELTYSFEITNDGPDTATGISFNTYLDPSFVALDQSQGKCRFDAQNIYCNLGELRKGATATILYRGRCRWDFCDGDRPSQDGGLRVTPMVRSAEPDPNYENNRFSLSTPVRKDPNLPPVVVLVKPTDDELMVGPDATVNIIANAYDRDGSISAVEFFDHGVAIGAGKLTGRNTYELTYQNVAFGRHWLQAVATDSQGRPALSKESFITVNGPIQIRITQPQPKFVVNPPHDPYTVRLHASNPKGGIKKIMVKLFARTGSGLTEVAQSVGKDEYTATFKRMALHCSGPCYVTAVATDDAGVDTTTGPVEFRVNHIPDVRLSFVKGEYAYDFKDGAEFDADAPLNLSASVGGYPQSGIVKVDFYLNNTLFATVKNEKDSSQSYPSISFDVEWRPTPGTYTLTAVAVDEYGAVGKSIPVKVIVRDRRR